MATPSALEMENVSLDKEETKRPNFPLDVSEQTALLTATREHYQVIQVLSLGLLILALMVPFIPLWCKFNGVPIGLNQMMIDTWVNFADVNSVMCLQRLIPDFVCLSAGDFHMAGLAFQVLWVLTMLMALYNVANLQNLIKKKSWRWAQVEFLHLIVPCFYFFSAVMWWALAKVYYRPQFEYQLGFIIALAVGTAQSLLGLYYYRQKLRQDEAEVPNYFMIPSS